MKRSTRNTFGVGLILFIPLILFQNFAPVNVQDEKLQDPAVFDPVEYLDLNADVAAAGIAANEHWVLQGHKECRRSSRSFYAKDYLELNKDVADFIRSRYQPSEHCKQAALHYVMHGRNENRPTLI